MSTEDDKAKILARRARFIAAALASAGLAAAAPACGGETGGPEGSELPEKEGGARDAQAEPQVCLSGPEPLPDAGPEPCLSPEPPDAGSDADAGPQPCLVPPP